MSKSFANRQGRAKAERAVSSPREVQSVASGKLKGKRIRVPVTGQTSKGHERADITSQIKD